MKRKPNKTIIGLVGAVVILLILIFVVMGRISGNNDDKPDTTTTTEPTSAEDVLNLEEITNPAEIIEPSQKVDEDMVTLAPPEIVTNANNKKPVNNNEKETVASVTPVTPLPDEPGIVIIGDDDANVYDCGAARHNCDSKETHDFIVGLEKKGCPMCKSHNCRSFYAVDEWGNACYDMTICPEYSVKDNPTEYCAHCGKKIGDGSNGTCVRYVNDTTCEICKGAVKGKTCHSH